MPQTKTFTSASGVDELTASQSIDLSRAYDAKYLRTVVSMGRTRGQRPWKWMDQIGEVNYGITRGAKIAGYAKITARLLQKDGTPGKIVTTGQAADIANMLSSPYGGQRGLVDRFFTLMKVPGDAYLIRCKDGGEVCGYDFIGSNEIAMESTDGTGAWSADGSAPPTDKPLRRITLPGGAGSTSGDYLYVDIAAGDMLGRVWRPAGQYVDLANSPMRSLDTECELLHLLTINLKAKLTSRMALNGIFFVPSEINDIRTSSPSGKENEFHDNKVLDSLIRAATWAIINHEDPKAAVPIFMTGPGQYGSMIQHIVMDQELYQTDMKLRTELIHRILTGLDVSKQMTEGNEKVNHWGSWASSDDELRVNVKPDLEMMCWALTRMVLYREMLAAGTKPSTVAKYCLWFDLDDATTAVDPAENARQAIDRILISPAAARKATGFKEADAPSDLEAIRLIGAQISDPYLATYGMPEQAKFDWTKIGSAAKGPDPASQGDPPEAAPGNGKPGSPGNNKTETPRRLRPA